MNELKGYHTSLAKTDNVKDTLSWKLESIREDGLPTDTGLADYIALSLDEIAANLAQLKSVKQEVALRENQLKSQSKRILEEGAVFIEEFGVDRLDGNICSSVTITKAKPARTKTKKVFELYTDKADMENFLIESGLAGWEYEEEEVDEVPAKLRVNRRKIIVPEVEE